MPSNMGNALTYHLVVDFVKVDLADFVHDVLAFECDESEASMTIGLLVEHEHGVFNLQLSIVTRRELSFICAMLLACQRSTLAASYQNSAIVCCAIFQVLIQCSRGLTTVNFCLLLAISLSYCLARFLLSGKKLHKSWNEKREINFVISR